MLLKLAVLVVALGVLVTGQNLCCFPVRYEAAVADVFATFNSDTGVATAARRYQTYSLDVSDPDNRSYRRDRLAVDVYTQARSTDNILIKDGIQYNFNDTNCESSPAAPDEFGNCITSQDQFRGSIYIGLGEHRLNLEVWRLFRSNTTIGIEVTSNCVPVAFSMAGREGSGSTKQCLDGLDNCSLYDMILFFRRFYSIAIRLLYVTQSLCALKLGYLQCMTGPLNLRTN